jgi:putative membrane protein
VNASAAAPARLPAETSVTPRFALACLVAVLLAMAVSAYRMEMLADWLLENLLVFLFLLVMAPAWRRVNLTSASYLMIVAFLALHEWGAHYKYADVPLGEWLKPVFHTNRNHFDRVVHFSFGLFLTWPMCEGVVQSTNLRPRWWPAFIALLANLACSAVYEILEFVVSQMVDPEIGIEFVGAQGDVWDAQKDMAMAWIGAVIPLIFWIMRKRPA